MMLFGPGWPCWQRGAAGGCGYEHLLADERILLFWLSVRAVFRALSAELAQESETFGIGGGPASFCVRGANQRIEEESTRSRAQQKEDASHYNNNK